MNGFGQLAKSGQRTHPEGLKVKSENVDTVLAEISKQIGNRKEKVGGWQ